MSRYSKLEAYTATLESRIRTLEAKEGTIRDPNPSPFLVDPFANVYLNERRVPVDKIIRLILSHLGLSIHWPNDDMVLIKTPREKQ